MGRPGLGRNVAVSRVRPFVVHGRYEDMRGRQSDNAGSVSMEALVEDGHKGGETGDHFLGAIGGGPEGAGDPSGGVGVNLANEAYVFYDAFAVRCEP